MDDPLEAALTLHKERKDYEIKPVLAHELLLQTEPALQTAKGFLPHPQRINE